MCHWFWVTKGEDCSGWEGHVSATDEKGRRTKAADRAVIAVFDYGEVND